MRLHPQRTPRARLTFNFPIRCSRRRAPRPRNAKPLKRNDAQQAEVMNKSILTLAVAAIIFLPRESAFGYGHANAYGGSTSHSYGSTSHSNAYGGSTSHTYGEGSSHTNEYGGSTSHNYDGGTTHTNA